jgi:hypothetical protein
MLSHGRAEKYATADETASIAKLTGTSTVHSTAWIW